MGLLESHGRTHHLLLLCVACSSRCRLACSSSSTITMAATPHRMLKWASWRSNSCLLNIVTTAEMPGEAQWPTFIHAPIFGEGGWESDNDCAITCRWPQDHPMVIRWQSTDLWTSPEIARSPDGHWQVPQRWPSDNARENWPLAASFGRSPSGHPAVTVSQPLSQCSKLFKVRRIGRRSADVEKQASGNKRRKILRSPHDL